MSDLTVQLHRYGYDKKTLIQNFRSDFDHFTYVHFRDFAKARPHLTGVASGLSKVRVAQSVLHGHAEAMVIGDSRMHQFENSFDRIPNLFAVPLSGSRASDWEIIWAPVCLPATPKVVFSDEAGNDFLGGVDLDTVIHTRTRELEAMRKQGIRPVVYGICYLGPDCFPEVNEKITSYNIYMQHLMGDDFLDVNGILSSDKNIMKSQYDCGDHVHHTQAAFDDCYGPITARKMKALGIDTGSYLAV